jgi:hypothetical protein
MFGIRGHNSNMLLLPQNGRNSYKKLFSELHMSQVLSRFQFFVWLLFQCTFLQSVTTHGEITHTSNRKVHRRTA